MSNSEAGTRVAARSGSAPAPARTRGGWAPAGTAAARRVAQGERTTAKGLRTRDELVTAARRVFERDGYSGARGADIAAEGGVAHRSFYTYFSSKQDAFLAVVRGGGSQVRDAILAPGGPGGNGHRAPDRSTPPHPGPYRANT